MPENLAGIISLLQCPECQIKDSLLVGPVDPQMVTVWRGLIGEAQLANMQLRCRYCNREFPITESGIPLIWSDTLYETFQKMASGVEASTVPGEMDVKAANIHVYEATVEQYDAVGIHLIGSRKVDYWMQLSWVAAFHGMDGI